MATTVDAIVVATDYAAIVIADTPPSSNGVATTSAIYSSHFMKNIMTLPINT